MTYNAEITFRRNGRVRTDLYIVQRRSRKAAIKEALSLYHADQQPGDQYLSIRSR